jgi:pilus assembly protein CpaC
MLQGSKSMTKAPLTRIATFAALIVMTMSGQTAPTTAADAPRRAFIPAGAPAMPVQSDEVAKPISLGVGKSIVVDLPGEIKDVLVANPKIANAVVRTSRRAYLIGVAVGQTNVFFFGADGKQLMGFDIAVTRDLNGIRAAIKKMLPNADITVDGLADGIMLAGSAASPVEAQQAFDLAARLAGDGNKVVNGIIVRSRDQVMLKVTVAEVQREVVKQLGIDLSGSLAYGSVVVDFNNSPPFGNAGQALFDPETFIRSKFTWGGNNVTAKLRAMESANVIRILAEPNLTAISGESANFLAGGEFPVVTGSTCDANGRSCSPTIQYKKFGVGLNFTPIVLSEGRINLRVGTEVSEISPEAAVQGIPGLRVNRTETSVEIPSGGALALAGLIKEQTKQTINGLPGLMQLPVLGPLFKSRDYQNRQTELVILVTPFVVRAVAQKDLSRPDDGFADASDPAAILIGRFNRLYGAPGRGHPRPHVYRGNYGFILD